MGDERILGRGDFVQFVLDQAREQYEIKALARVKGVTIETLIERLLKQLDVVPADLWSTGKHRKVARARAIICTLAIDYLRVSGREVALRLNLSPSAASKLMQRGRKDELTEKLAQVFFRAHGPAGSSKKSIFHHRSLMNKLLDKEILSG